MADDRPDLSHPQISLSTTHLKPIDSSKLKSPALHSSKQTFHVQSNQDRHLPSIGLASTSSSNSNPSNSINPASHPNLSVADNRLTNLSPHSIRRATESHASRHDLKLNSVFSDKPSLPPSSALAYEPIDYHSSSIRLHRSNNSRPTPLIARKIHWLSSAITSSLWVSEPGSIRRPHADSIDRIPRFKRFLALLTHQTGLGSLTVCLMITLIVMGIIEVFKVNDPQIGLDTQDWGPTRLRVGQWTHAKTNSLKVKMRERPFEILSELGALPNQLPSFSQQTFGLANRWLRPLPGNDAPLASRGSITADVTAVVLNWHRLENMIVIVAHLCRYDFFEAIIIWNNDPLQRLTREDFKHTHCPAHKLSIYNAPSNMFFFARFLACLQSKTKYCYFQDDDCIVNSIRSMYFQFQALQPDDRAIVVQADPIYSVMYGWEWCFNDRLGWLHTCFAWLGHGSFVSKTSVLGFLNLISEQALPSDSIALADNFFATALNHQPTVIVSSKILSLPFSSKGFSDGTAGLEQNRLYIQRGVEKLMSLLYSDKMPRMSQNVSSIQKGIVRAAERGDRAFLVTNVEAFPGRRPAFEHFKDGLAGWEDQVGTTGYSLGRAKAPVGLRRTRADWVERERGVTEAGYAAAMDDDMQTAWISAGSIQKGDWVGLAWIDKITQPIIKVHFIVSEPEGLKENRVVERLIQKNVWEVVDSLEEKLECLPIEKGEKSDCVLSILANPKGCFGVRIRKLEAASSRWCLWETSVAEL
ncbi:hypothetical protein O181_021158 [Austropuccinia psidii MF-1]|uniref:Uncharacterized protein n=1 Tax=Austropuccinia psidii MF-1 TaxID=1389203 RepID=A0A9Q3CCT9_9BASI|nr:hypothetical protein [Austropuccinia psidii MF-1]